MLRLRVCMYRSTIRNFNKPSPILSSLWLACGGILLYLHTARWMGHKVVTKWADLHPETRFIVVIVIIIVICILLFLFGQTYPVENG